MPYIYIYIYILDFKLLDKGILTVQTSFMYLTDYDVHTGNTLMRTARINVFILTTTKNRNCAHR